MYPWFSSYCTSVFLARTDPHDRRDLKVYGWGISLERPTMIRFGISNIRELLGHKVNLDFVQTSPAVRLDKE